MLLVKIPLDEIKPAKYNPRKDLREGDPEYEKIKKSILEFGLVDPLIVNHDNTLISGHQRLKVLTDLDHKEADCVKLKLTKKKEKALNLAMNKITGKWDTILLKDLLLDLDTGNFDMSLTGFSPGELENLLTVPTFEIENKETEPEEDENAKTIVKCPECGHEFEPRRKGKYG